MRKEDRAYIAGFFDGEGCISASPRRLHLRISITQKKPGVLYELQSLLGMGNVRVNPRGVHRFEITYQIGVERFIRLVLPYSRVKRTQLKVGLRFLKAEPDRRLVLCERLRELKR